MWGVYICVCMYTCMRLEARGQHQVSSPQSTSTLLFETDVLVKLELTTLASLANQQTTGIMLFLPSRSAQGHHPAVYCGARDSNSSSHVNGHTLPTSCLFSHNTIYTNRQQENHLVQTEAPGTDFLKTQCRILHRLIFSLREGSNLR